MRSNTENIYKQKVNQVLDYISMNLDKPLSLDKLARLIHVSQRQLIRIMRSALNEPLSSYITRQRVERSVLYMQIEKLNLMQLAEKVGYDSPQSLSKAFKRHFGIPPKTYINELQAKLEGYVKSSRGGQDMSSEVCDVESLELVYIRIVGKYGEDASYNEAWKKLVNFLSENQALSPMTRFIGISYDDPNVTKSEQCRFYACASVQKEIVPSGDFGTIRLPKGKYAVYTLKGSYSGLQELHNNISIHFCYTPRYGLVFEEYLNSPHDTREDDLITRIFIPIK